MVGIRVDANDTIAMGHLMRCMSIAFQLKNKGCGVKFIISEDYARESIIQNGFECICLYNRYNEKEKETQELIKIIEDNGIDRLLLDSYEVTYDYMARLKEHTKIIYIDDLNAFLYPADLIINYTYGTNIEEYKDRDYKNQRFLLGSKYVPLREEFAGRSILIKKEIGDIFITTGGTDQYDMIIGILEKLQESAFNKARKHVVAGKFYKHMDKLHLLASGDSSIHIYHNVKDIWNVMRASDIAISAGGTTLAELCACGVPSICFAIADNQLSGTKAYEEGGLLFYAGDVRENREKVRKHIVQLVEYMNQNPLIRREMSLNAKSTIDGKGALRIAEEMISIPDRV